MGGGYWTKKAFCTYSASVGRSVDSSTGCVTDSFSNQEIYKAKKLDDMLNPYKVIRECRDSEEHPNTIPVILALDVTGSMGDAAVEVSKKLNKIMTDIYDEVKDVEFLVMGIGDVECDRYPIQASQFESDIRIAEQLDKIYFEFGGGGNSYESYTAAWYFGLNNTSLDCWKRGKKGIIITMGDERLNPVLSIRKNYQGSSLNEALGCSEQSGVETKDLYNKVCEKFDVYHIDVNHSAYRFENDGIDKSWALLGDNYRKCTMDNISDTIVDIITSNCSDSPSSSTNIVNEKGEIVW